MTINLRSISSRTTFAFTEIIIFVEFVRARGGLIFFDITDPSQIIEVVEPLFLNLNATTELMPVMTAKDLRKGLGKLSAH